MYCIFSLQLFIALPFSSCKLWYSPTDDFISLHHVFPCNDLVVGQNTKYGNFTGIFAFSLIWKAKVQFLCFRKYISVFNIPNMKIKVKFPFIPKKNYHVIYQNKQFRLWHTNLAYNHPSIWGKFLQCIRFVFNNLSWFICFICGAAIYQGSYRHSKS